MKTVLLSFPWEDDPVYNRLKEHVNLIGSQYSVMGDQEFNDLLPQADALIIGWDRKLTAEMLQLAQKLKIIAKVGGAVGNLDTEEIFKRGIMLTNGAEAFAQGTAELTLALILDCLRDISQNNLLLKTDVEWSCTHGHELCNKKVGVVGSGVVARKLIRLLSAFDTDISVYSPRFTSKRAEELGVKAATLDALFENSDVVCICCALTSETYHLVDAARLALLKPGSVLVNTSRGGVVDEPALVSRAQQGEIKVGLDVFEPEPLQKESALRQLSNVVLTSHIGASQESFLKVKQIIVDDIIAFFEQRVPENVLNSEKVSRMTAW